MENSRYKFRAWEPEEKQMIYFGLFGTDEGYHIQSNDQYTVMQYTGLKDKNGKEIYEGDVLNCIEKSEHVTDKEWGPIEVVFTHGCFNVVIKKCCEHCRDGFGIICSVYECVAMCETEIIGNIHEDKHLLK